MNEPFQKPRRSTKSREVSSRYLQTTPASPSRDINGGHPSSSPVSQAPASPGRAIKSAAATTVIRKSRNHDDPGATRGAGLLWPSYAVSSNPSTNNSAASGGGGKATKTLGDHLLGSKRLINEVLEEKGSDPDKLSAAANSGFSALGRQRSGREVTKCESDRAIQFQKENNRPGGIGGSFRYAGGKLGFRGGTKPSSPSSSSSSSSSTSTSSSSSNTLLYTNACYVPGRFSVDENALYKSSLPGASSRRQSDVFPERIDQDLRDWTENCAEFECFDPKIEKSVSNRRRKSGIEVSSKYLNNLTRRGPDPKSLPGSPSLDGGSSPSANLSPKRNKKLNIKTGFRRAHSLTLPGSTGPSKWALSPGRTGSPSMTVENKERPMSFSTWKPPTSPKKHGGMEKLLSLGLDFFKSSAKIKRISSSSSSSTSTSNSNSSSSSAAFSASSSSSSLLDNAENVHQLRLIHGRMLQWRYANARGETANEKLEKQAESDMVLAWSTIVRKRQNVVKMRLQLQREQLAVKLESILHSQMKALEIWGEMERQHSAALSKTQESLNAVVCRVPLIKGARVNEELTSLAFRHATDLTNSIKWTLSTFSPPADETVEMISELAKVVAQEKLLIQEFHEIQHTISALQVKESDLKAAIIQLTSLQQLQHHHQEQQEERC